LPRFTKAKPHNHKPLPGSRQGFFAKFGGTTMESEAWDSMKRVRGLLTVAKCFAAKGVEKDDVPAWIAGTFATLLDLIENERLASRWRKLANPTMTAPAA
jgi:hypothetical protein